VRRGIDIQATGTIAAVGTLEVLPAGGKGYQECGLTGKAAATETGLSGSTAYYLFVAINGGTSTEYTFTTAADTTFAAVIILLNAAITGVTFALINGDLRCTSDSTAAKSAIALAAGTTGTDFFATLTDFAALETAVKPTGSTYFLTEIDIMLTAYSATGTLALSDGTDTWFGPWLCKDGNGTHIHFEYEEENPWMWTTLKPLQLVNATANVGARIMVKGWAR
jgi:hypothetical protein